MVVAFRQKCRAMCIGSWRDTFLLMKRSDEALSELMRLYKEEFGEELSRNQAEEMARKLLTLYELLAQKLPGENIPAPKPPAADPPAAHQA